MKSIITLICLAVAASLVGCAVHDDHQEDPAPVWWPAFMYKPTTHPSDEEYDQARGAAVGDATVAFSVSTPQHDVRAEWNPNYAEHPVVAVPTPDNLSRASVGESPAAATVYPNRGEAAVAANSATLYPPTNEFNAGPAHTASVYPRGPLAPTGYMGR